MSHDAAVASWAAALRAAWQRSDDLFACIAPAALDVRPIALRHPLRFYLGHLPAFAWNQIGCGVLAHGCLHEQFDVLFERGIDPADAADAADAAAAATPATWPGTDEIVAYRDRVRGAVLACLPALCDRADLGDDVLASRIVPLVVEHELMHHETLLYMLQEAPPGVFVAPAGVDVLALPGGDGMAAEPCHVPAGFAVLGARFGELAFGWDNEFERCEVEVPSFRIDSVPVRNRDWRDFLAALAAAGDGRVDSLVPVSWAGQGASATVKTVLGPAPFELAAGWPVQVSGVQARAYCAWRGGRLATEAELHRAARGDGDASFPWGHEAPGPAHGNFDGPDPGRWAPVPVGQHPAGRSPYGVDELVGNGWEWTCTPFAPLPGFTSWARTYPGYSSDFFDDDHDVVFGASWATHRQLLRPSFRNWYRRTYPYVFSSFRLVHPA